MINSITLTQSVKAQIQQRVKEALDAADIPAMVFTVTTLDKDMLISIDVPYHLGRLAEVAGQVDAAFAADVELYSIAHFFGDCYAINLRIVDVTALLARECAA